MDIKISRDELGESLHTGLRKGVDSRWASLTHTAINLIDPEIWGWFLDILHNNFEREGISAETLKYVFTEFGSMSLWEMHQKLGTESEYRDFMDKHRQDSTFHYHENVFMCAVNMIGDDDAKSLMHWFDYVHKYEEQIKAS